MRECGILDPRHFYTIYAIFTRFYAIFAIFTQSYAILHDFTRFYTILRDFHAISRDFCDFYAFFSQAQNVLSQAPKTIMQACLQTLLTTDFRCRAN